MIKIPLADMLIELRRELDEARREGAKQGLRFRVDSIDVELQMIVSKGAEVGSKFKFWVIDSDAKGMIASESCARFDDSCTRRQRVGRPGRWPST